MKLNFIFENIKLILYGLNMAKFQNKQPRKKKERISNFLNKIINLFSEANSWEAKSYTFQIKR